MKQKGFTLLEILLVIAAIGILAAIVIVAINPNRQLAQARNAERRSAVNTVSDALNQYLIDTGSYPSGLTSDYQELCAISGGSSCLDIVPDLVPTYLSGIPVDSAATGDGSGYLVGIHTENSEVSVYAQNAELTQTITQNRLLWTPEQYTGNMLYWLDGSDLSTIQGANGVSDWLDKSGNDNHFTQAVSSLQPTYQSSTIGGRGSVVFDGVDDYLTHTGTSALGDGIVVAQRAVEEMPIFQYDIAQFRGFLGDAYPGFATHASYAINGNLLAGAPNSAVVTPHIVYATGSNFGGSTPELQLGRGTPSYQYLDGFISEMIIFDSVLSSQDRELFEGYLAHRWGLQTDLPLTHPYRNNPPYLP